METTFQAAIPVSTTLDGESFAALARSHWPDMARLARRLAAPGHWEDVLQDALSAAWRKRSQFDPDRGPARNWLLAIVADQAYKGRRRQRPTLELVDAAASGTADPDVDVDLRAALLRLTRRQRTAVVLHYYLGLPIAEVADVLGCSAGTVKSTLSDARAHLNRDLNEEYRNA